MSVGHLLVGCCAGLSGHSAFGVCPVAVGGAALVVIAADCELEVPLVLQKPIVDGVVGFDRLQLSQVVPRRVEPLYDGEVDEIALSEDDQHDDGAVHLGAQYHACREVDADHEQADVPFVAQFLWDVVIRPNERLTVGHTTIFPARSKNIICGRL